MVHQWITSLDKKPADRTGEDLDIIYSRLKDLKAFEKFHPLFIQQICHYGYYEDLDSGVILFRHGDIGTNWYTVLSGSLDVCVSGEEASAQPELVTLCTLGVGTAFGESILNDAPRHSTVVTTEYCELLRVEQHDFKILWEKNKQLMEGVINPLEVLPPAAAEEEAGKPEAGKPEAGKRKCSDPEERTFSNPATPIVTSPAERLVRGSQVLRTVILSRSPGMIRDRKLHLRTYRRCMSGGEMVNWFMQHSWLVQSRHQAVGMWQALVEQALVVHVCREHPMRDGDLFFRFDEDEQNVWQNPSAAARRLAEDQLAETLTLLAQLAGDAMMRLVLRTPAGRRSETDAQLVYEELLHIKALSHLSTMVKRELANVMLFEAYPKADYILFNQGDEGACWYIILKGSVNVVIHGKGVVCTLHEGDDFGKLALVNDSPRAASIILREDNCHFLRVDKDDFNRILRDVEANTVRLKEHGKDVLVLEKTPYKLHKPSGEVLMQYKYSVMAGTAEKILEHLLENCFNKNEEVSSKFLDDYLLTHVIFMPSKHLCPTLLAYFHTRVASTAGPLRNKRRIVDFVEAWSSAIGRAFFEDRTARAFLEELTSAVAEAAKEHPELREDMDRLDAISHKQLLELMDAGSRVCPFRRSSVMSGQRTSPDGGETRPVPIKPTDTHIFKVYCADHTYTAMKMSVDSPVSRILKQAADKMGLGRDDLVLCEVKSTGERCIFKEHDTSVVPALSINGRLFIAPKEHLDSLTPLPEQDGPSTSCAGELELISSKQLAFQITLFDWQLFTCIHEYELIYEVLGRAKFGRPTANLNAFLRRFNVLQFWVVSELCLAASVGKRVAVLKKFIKVAAYCKDFKNLNSFFAIVMGLSNIAVSRLSQTWEKLPGKLKKLLADFERTMDPSRNHRLYRLIVGKLQPPVIPFMPLLMKDLTFTHEGNKTNFEGLVNFEKMHMIASTLRLMQHCRSKELDLEEPSRVSSQKTPEEVRKYVRSLTVIDNQRVLTRLSHKLEPRR